MKVTAFSSKRLDVTARTFLENWALGQPKIASGRWGMGMPTNSAHTGMGCANILLRRAPRTGPTFLRVPSCALSA